MYKNYKRENIDPNNPFLPTYYGTFEIPVKLGEKSRRVIVYIPKDIRESTSGILVLGENGKTADDLLLNSGWCDIADEDEHKEKLIVFFLEPENGVWNIDEAYGKTDGDIAYVEAVYAIVMQRYLFCVHESKVYLTGCKEGGIIAHMAAMYNPAAYSGLVTVGGSRMNSEYIQAVNNDYCTNLNGFMDEKHELNIQKSNIPLPVWIIDDSKSIVGKNNGILEYWCHANNVEMKSYSLSTDQVEYRREKSVSVNCEKKAYRVCYSNIDNSSDCFAKRLQRRIWTDFLYKQQRWMGEPGGELRVKKDPVCDLEMDYYYKNIDDWMREWYVYVPKSIKQAKDKKFPLVFALHGYTCTGEIYAGNTQWHKVADEHGLIIVYPTALHAKINMKNNCIDPNNTPLPAWNVFAENDRPDEIHFFRELLDFIANKYPVDLTHIFATGHSWGSLMTQLLALTIPEKFAAVAPCSGVFFGDAEQRILALSKVKNRPDVKIPVWMFCGEKEEFLIDPVPTKDNLTGFNIELWLKLNHMEKQIPVNWQDCNFEEDGKWHNLYFKQDDTDIVRFTSVKNMPHATMPEMSFKIWEEFFCKCSRDEAKNLLVD